MMAFAWPRPEQDLKSYVGRAHDAGCKVTFMANGVPEAKRAAEAGADVIVAQGTEGGGHVGWQASMALVPMVVDAVAAVLDQVVPKHTAPPTDPAPLIQHSVGPEDLTERLR